MEGSKNCLVVLGPTASGKTALGVRLASRLDGVVLSADSRQVYRGLDFASGKDLSEYVGEDGRPVPYRLIDLIDLDEEYDLYRYRRDFRAAFRETTAGGRIPVLVGGTGLYLEAVLLGYRMVEAPENPRLRAELADLSDEELGRRLVELKPDLHNRTDLESRERTIRAIEIAETESASPSDTGPEIRPLVLGVERPVEDLNRRIADRLRRRLEAGLVEEIRSLHERGVAWERLESLGLECRFVADFLQGRIANRNDLFQKLAAAIRNFAKRQRTWFRRMERRGVKIRWIADGDFEEAWEVVSGETWILDSKNTS